MSIIQIFSSVIYYDDTAMRARKNILIIYVLLGGLLLSGCKPDEPSHQVVVPISICLPVGEICTSQRAPKLRVLGDPGTAEQFTLPNYIYYFVVNEDSEGEWKVWDIENATASDSDWEKKCYIGLYDTDGDSVFQYTKEFQLLLPNSRFNGRVYIIASAVELTFNTNIAVNDPESKLLGLKFSIDGSDEALGSVKNNLQNIYSTPYNYKGSGEDYYGSFYKEQKVPYLNLLLYHVAAKVDITWNVAADKRINKDDPTQAVRLTYMEAQHLFEGPAYCFKPMRNELTSKEDDGYSIANIVTATDEGLWWEGRSYFYAIPYVATDATSDKKVYFPLQMRMRTNGSEDTYQPTLNMRIDTSAVFVPWLRANFNLKAPLAEKTETKIIDWEEHFE